MSGYSRLRSSWRESNLMPLTHHSHYHTSLMMSFWQNQVDHFQDLPKESNDYRKQLIFPEADTEVVFNYGGLMVLVLMQMIIQPIGQDGNCTTFESR